MTREFYSVMGALHTLLFYLHKRTDRRLPPSLNFYKDLSTPQNMESEPAALRVPYNNVKNLFLTLMDQSLELASAVGELRIAYTDFEDQLAQSLDISKRELAAGAAGIPLGRIGTAGWLDIAWAKASPSPGMISAQELLAFINKVTHFGSKGAEYDQKLQETAKQADKLRQTLRTQASNLAQCLAPLLPTVARMDPGLHCILTDLMNEIKQAIQFEDGTGDTTGTWPSSYFSSSSSSGYYSSSGYRP